MNPRPHGPEPCALPTALHPDSFCIIAGFSRPVKCRPAVRRRTPGRSNQLHRGREQRQDMRMHRLLKNRSKRISLALMCRALKKEMRTLVGAPHGGAARLRRTSVLLQAKPRRRANSFCPSIENQTSGGRLRRPKPKKNDTPLGVSFFLPCVAEKDTARKALRLNGFRVLHNLYFCFSALFSSHFRTPILTY